MTGDNIRDNILDMVTKVVEQAVADAAGESSHIEEWNLDQLMEDAGLFLPHHTDTKEDWLKLSGEELQEKLKADALAYFALREEELGVENMENVARYVLLRVIDRQWMDHLDAMDHLRTGIGLQAIGQKNPLIEYKYAAYDMFTEMVAAIRREVVRFVMRARLNTEPQETVAVKNVQENRTADGAEKAKQPVRKDHSVGRNDPCPCGSGKKYKKCCGMQQK